MQSNRGLDFKGLNEVLLTFVGELLLAWLPGGNMISSDEFACADLQGGSSRRGSGGSLRVNIKTGKWADFATGEKGTDLISLYQAITGQDMKQAFNELKRIAGKDYTALPVNPRKYTRIMESAESTLVPPPKDAPPPNFVSQRWGSPTGIWTYRDEVGTVLFHVARYRGVGGTKNFTPFAWDGVKWVKRLWPAPRPMYGLWRLRKAEKPVPVLIVEGEKAADAADKLMNTYYDVVTWPSGSKAFDKVDWEPIYGRKILLWPDADLQTMSTKKLAEKFNGNKGDLLPIWEQPGTKAMCDLAKRLCPHCPEVKLIDIPLDDMFTKGTPGWDAADALHEEWTFQDVVEWAKPKAITLEEGFHPRAPIQKGNEHHGQQKMPSLSPPPPEPGYVKSLEKATAPIEVEVVPQNTGDLEEKEVEDIPRSIVAIWEDIGLVTTGKGIPVNNLDNVLRVLEGFKPLKNLVWYDEFHRKIFTNGYNGDRSVREWTDIDDITMSAMFQRTLGLQRVSGTLIHEAVATFAHKNKRNEPKDWMETLKWDDLPRVETFFIDYFGTPDTPYHRAVSKNFWVAMVARIYKPGCKADNMVIIEGEQGKFKSTALSVIGGEWFTEANESVMSKDFYMTLQGKLIIEIAELDAFSRGETTTIKRVVSQYKDRFRPPYGRLAQDFPRQCIFVGTTNDEEYLRDHTGGRRFWPIRITTIDINQLKKDREQLFAEAIQLFKNGATWHEVPDKETRAQQEHRRSSDEWEEIVGQFLLGKSQTTVAEVAKDGLGIEAARLGNLEQRRIGRVLHILGWRKTVLRQFGRSMKVWRAPTTTEDTTPPDPPPKRGQQSFL